jgi:hypothetical protein
MYAYGVLQYSSTLYTVLEYATCNICYLHVYEYEQFRLVELSVAEVQQNSVFWVGSLKNVVASIHSTVLIGVLQYSSTC